MALNIKNAETEKLARELARGRRQGITAAVTAALRRELDRAGRRPRRESREAFLNALREIGERGSRYPVLDSRSDEEILGYDEMTAEPGGTNRW